MPERYERPPSYWSSAWQESQAYLDQWRTLVTARACMVALTILVAIAVGASIIKKGER